MRPGSLRSVPIAAPSVQGKPCKARNGRWTGRPHRESPRASVSASPVIIYYNYYNACLKTQSDRLLGAGDMVLRHPLIPSARTQRHRPRRVRYAAFGLGRAYLGHAASGADGLWAGDHRVGAAGDRVGILALPVTNALPHPGHRAIDA